MYCTRAYWFWCRRSPRHDVACSGMHWYVQNQCSFFCYAPACTKPVQQYVLFSLLYLCVVSCAVADVFAAVYDIPGAPGIKYHCVGTEGAPALSVYLVIHSRGKSSKVKARLIRNECLCKHRMVSRAMTFANLFGLGRLRRGTRGQQPA